MNPYGLYADTKTLIESAIGPVRTKGNLMPISMGDFAAARRTFTYETEIGGVQVTYRPYAMTPARESQIARIAAAEADPEDAKDVQETDQGLTKIVTQFCEIVEAIDMVGPVYRRLDPRTGRGIGDPVIPAGESVPIEPEVVRFFSNTFIVGVLVAVSKDARPKTRKPDNSNDS